MRGLLVLYAVLVWTAELSSVSVAAHNIRVELLRNRESPNNITLICRNNSVTLEAADFWVNSTDQPLTSILSRYNKRMGEIQFVLLPDIEGSYFCGDISAELVSSNNWTLVAYPMQRHNFSVNFYSAEVGSSVTLSCPFTKGALTQLYSYSWMKGLNTVVANTRHIPRFSGNSTDFSLTIQNLTLSDNSEYLCRISIKNPIGNNWAVDSDPIQLCVYDTNSTTVSVMNRCAVTSTPAVSLPAVSTSPVSVSVSITTNTKPTMSINNTESTMNPHNHSLLALHEVAYIALGGGGIVLTFLLCAIGAIVAFKVRSKKRSRHNQRQPHNITEQEEQPVRSIQGSSECAEEQPARSNEQLQSQEHIVPPSEETRDVPGILPIEQGISETNHGNMHTPSGASHVVQSKQDSLSMWSPLLDAATTSSVQSRSCPSRSSEMCVLEPTDDYQDDSNELMFLGSVKVLVCDSRGGKFEIPEHDITLRFPQGAVPDTTELEVHVGIAIHGLFNFPDDLRPISVLVWVQFPQRPDFEFQKPVEISLPHYLNLSKDDARNSRNLGLSFMVTDREEDDHHHLTFKEGAKERVSYKQTKAIISTTHFCYMCLSAKASVIAEKSSYLLTQVQPEPITPLRWQIHFCVSYDLCSFTEMIKQQYRSQGKVVSQKTFQFTSPSAEKKSELEIRFQPPIKGWQLTLPTYKTVTWKSASVNFFITDVAALISRQISRSDVELWEDDVSMLQNRVMREHFPPRVTVEVAGEGAFGNTTQLFSFEGAHPKLESEVHLCLPAQHVGVLLPPTPLPLSSTSSPCSPMSCLSTGFSSLSPAHTQTYLEPRHVTISPLDPPPQMRAIASDPSYPDSLPRRQAHPDEPTDLELHEVMNVIAGHMGVNWSTLIPVLGIPLDKEQGIFHDCPGLKTQILRMLQTWKMLHQSDGTNTRAHLAAILRGVDRCLHPAAKILERPRTQIRCQSN